MAFRAFYALPDTMTTSTGQVTNAVTGFASMLTRLMTTEAPTHIAVAFDVGRVTFRTERMPQYKGTRSETPEAFKGQVPLIKEVLDAMNIRHVERQLIEADDFLATLAARGSEAGMEVLVCSGDRDTLQLVTDDVTVLYPIKGVSELARMTPAAVEAKYGVTPEHYPDLAALVGETSDNIPGIPLVGPVKAAKWMAQFGSLDALLDQADTITGKTGQNLRAGIDQVRLNREINTLLRDVELPFSLDELAVTPFNREAVHQIADTLQWGTRREAILAADPGGHSVEESLPPDPTVTAADFQPGQLGAWLATLTPRRVGVDVTGRGTPVGGDAWTVALAPEAGVTARTGVSVDLATMDAADEAALATWLADPATPKVLHGAKAAEHCLAARGMTLRGVECDTELAAYLCHPDQRSYDLEDLAQRYLHRTLGSGGGVAVLFEVGDDATQTGIDRAAAIADLGVALEAALADQRSEAVLRDLELPLTTVLARMERAGIAADHSHLEGLSAEFGRQALAAAAEAYQSIDREVNLSSPKQLQDVLFTQLGMPKTKKTKTGYTTDAAALAELYVKTHHPFLTHLLTHRDVTKLKQTVDGLIKTVSSDGRIHTTFQQTVAATGRLSSKDPNLQNIPIRTQAGQQIRQAFVVGTGYETLLTADYSQIEMRIMAHLSQDEGLIDAFNKGEDLHRYVGSHVYGVDTQDVTAEMRSHVKAMSYGLAYGLSEFGLAQQLGISQYEARDLMNDYFSRFGGVKRYLDSVVEDARRTGYTSTIVGRRRYLPDLTSTNPNRRALAERAALNAPIQGSAADIIKLAMLAVDSELNARNMSTRMLLQVHDELILEVAPGEADEAEEVLKAAMENAYPMSVPLDVSVGKGGNWLVAGH
jgi:DNA polymerase-1